MRGLVVLLLFPFYIAAAPQQHGKSNLVVHEGTYASFQEFMKQELQVREIDTIKYEVSNGREGLYMAVFVDSSGKKDFNYFLMTEDRVYEGNYRRHKPNTKVIRKALRRNRTLTRLDKRRIYHMVAYMDIPNY